MEKGKCDASEEKSLKQEATLPLAACNCLLLMELKAELGVTVMKRESSEASHWCVTRSDRFSG